MKTTTFSLTALVCAAAAASAASAGNKYIPLDGCAETEGDTLGDRHRNCDATCCAALCDAHPECNSFSLFGVAKICYLKTRCILPSEPVKVNKYVTWYKSCGEDPLDIAAADPRLKSAITATDESPVGEILDQIHSYCVEELYTDKYKSKSGALMGSKIVKSNMEDPHSTKCSNADWLRSISKLDWKRDDFKALIEGEKPCEAGKMYHILNSGIGSWVSNVANLLYTHSQLPDGPQKTLAFRDQQNRPHERWDLLFSHEMPLCPKFEGKSTPFVRPNVIETLKLKNVCDYAATKMFFTQELWNTILRGALKDDLNEQVELHVAAMRKAAVGASGGGASDFSGAYIGIHLRHKWEFKLQPPKLADVAKLIRASAAQIDPFAHRDVSHADPQCFADEAHRASVWGPERTVVFCASDDVEACESLQSILGEKFFVHSIPNLKINTGREGVLAYLLDVALLEKAGLFIGSGASNLSRMVNAIRGPTKLSMSMDIDWNTVHF